MVFLNYTTMQMTAKIVYYGPGLCGKTTNLQHIHQKTASRSRGEMISLETETDRTLFFDLLPLDVGVIGGMRVRLQLYTVPGQVFYNATRKLVLKGVDGVVFVADSQVAALDANVESLRNLEANLAELGLSLDQVPLVFQYNKRDIRNINPVETLNQSLNARNTTYFEAAALHGIGVFETLKDISRLALGSVRRKVAEEKVPQPPRPGIVAVLAPAPAPTPQPQPAARATLAPRASANPLAELLAPTTEDVAVEFAEEDTDRHVRAVATKGHVDIRQELENLRTLTASPQPRAAPGPSKEVERRLQDMLLSDTHSRQDLKRKASVDVPARLLKGASALRLHVALDGDTGEEVVHNAVVVRVSGNPRLERLTLHLDLELKGKG